MPKKFPQKDEKQIFFRDSKDVFPTPQAFADHFLELLHTPKKSPHGGVRIRSKNPNYQGSRWGVLYARRINMIRKRIATALQKTYKPISSGTINNHYMTPEIKKQIKWNTLSYEEMITILPLLCVSFNSWTLLHTYNTEDWQIRRLQDYFPNKKTHLGLFWSIIPTDIKDTMTQWKMMNIPLDDAVLYRTKLLETLSTSDWWETYNTEDWQIRRLQTYSSSTAINLTSFWSIIPIEIKQKMTQWKMMNIPLDDAVLYRTKLLETLSTSDWWETYNTEDWQIRRLQDNVPDKKTHLGSFWSIIPIEIKQKMTCWRMMNMSLDDAVLYRKRLLETSEKLHIYNTEDWQIRRLQDNFPDKKTHLGLFWSIVPGSIKHMMTCWSLMNMSLDDAVLYRNKLLEIPWDKSLNTYNTEDWQIRRLQDNFPDKKTHLGTFWSIVPKNIKHQMTRWKIINTPFREMQDLIHYVHIMNIINSLNISYDVFYCMSKKLDNRRLQVLDQAMSTIGLTTTYPFVLKNFIIAWCDTVDSNNFDSYIDVLNQISNRPQQSWEAVSEILNVADKTLMSNIQNILWTRFKRIFARSSQDAYYPKNRITQYQWWHSKNQIVNVDDAHDWSLLTLLTRFIPDDIIDAWIESGDDSKVLSLIHENQQLKDQLREYI
jgi:hypothetical protein